MDARGTASMARPAPPGRRRGPPSRNVSSASSSRLESSPTSSTAATVDEEGGETHVEAHTDGLGLNLGPGSNALSSEITLEDVETALFGLSREDLVLALKRAKEQMDILDSKLDGYVERNEVLESSVADLTSQVNLSEAEMESLVLALQQREERVNELMKEQDRDEGEVYAKMTIIERLRRQLEESERCRVDVERRYEDQTTTADKERQAYVDMESLVQTQKAKASTAHERILASNQELSRENERLQHIISQLRLSSRGLSRPPGVDDDEAVQDDSRGEVGQGSVGATSDESLYEEHEGGVSSRGIRTLHDEAKALEVEALHAELSAQQKSNDILTSQMQQLQADVGQAKAANVELREQNETYMDILQEKTFSGALIEESAVLNRRYMESDTEDSEDLDTDDVDDVPDEPRKQQRGKKSRELSAMRSQQLRSLPTSLASELETSEDGPEGKDTKRRERRKDRNEVLGDNIDDLHKEIWSLRDANQALTLYVTKILDRIIAKEGYENVLAIDGDEKSKMGTLRGTSSRLRGQRSRLSIIDTQTPPKQNRRASGGGLLSFMGANPAEVDERGANNTPTGASPSFAAKARRTASIDWRSLLGGAGSPTSPDRSLMDATRATLMGAVASPTTPGPRKISSSEEVEDVDDVEEKERIRREMISHGIQLPDNQLRSQKRASAFGTFLTRVIGTGNPLPSESSKREGGSESVVDRGDQHPGPRLTTFDSPPSMRPSMSLAQTGSSSGGGGRDGSRSDSPLDRSEARQRALDVGNVSNLTEVPKRTSPLSSRRNTIKRRDTSSTNASVGRGDSSRGESVAGDESYQFNSPTLGSEKALEEESGSESGWGKTFKRMSLMARPDRTS